MTEPQSETGTSRRLLRNLVKALGVVMVVMFAALMWPLITGGDKMETFCAGIDPGLSRATVLNSARVEGYDVRPYESDQAQLDLIVDRRAMGRFVCEVTYVEDSVDSARYIHND